MCVCVYVCVYNLTNVAFYEQISYNNNKKT